MTHEARRPSPISRDARRYFFPWIRGTAPHREHEGQRHDRLDQSSISTVSIPDDTDGAFLTVLFAEMATGLAAR